MICASGEKTNSRLFLWNDKVEETLRDYNNFIKQHIQSMTLHLQLFVFSWLSKNIFTNLLIVQTLFYSNQTCLLATHERRGHMYVIF